MLTDKTQLKDLTLLLGEYPNTQNVKSVKWSLILV